MDDHDLVKPEARQVGSAAHALGLSGGGAALRSSRGKMG